MKRYRVYSDYLKQRYGGKVYKLPVSLPVTCPNRDGTCGWAGCIFCGEIGAGYENLPDNMGVADQIIANKAHIVPKYKAEWFIPYLQNFSNTYLPPAELRQFLQQTISPGVVGVAVATRPDCISEDHLDVLEEFKIESGLDVFIEMGLQTVNYHTLETIKRGHTLAEFIDATMRCKRRGMELCAHMILSLPWDDMTDVIEGAKILSALQVEQVKLHALYVVKGTVLADWYEREEVAMIPLEEYVQRVIAFLEHLHPNIVVQRLIGRAPESHTDFSNWQTGWWKIRDAIEAELVRRDSAQGRLCNYLNGPAVRKFL